MMKTFPLLALLISTAAILSTTTAQSSEAQACVSNLVPCAGFMSAAKPPQTCCGPLKTAVTTQLTCLCGLYNTPGLLDQFKINITQALDLPKRCGIDGANLSACSTTTGTSAPSPATAVPPTGSSGTGAGKMAGAGMSGLVIILLSWVFTLVC